METTKTSGYAPVNGLKMYYEIYGTGTVPLVLIHGGGSTIESSFGNLLPLLSGSGKIIAVELQAHGRTNDRDVAESFEQDADDVAALLSYLHIDKANFLGFSNGGTTTLQLAIRHAALVNKIIVVAGAYQREGFITGFFESMPHATLDNMPKPLQEAFLKVTPDKTKLLAMFNRDKERMIHFKDVPDAVLSSIKVPALFMVGDRDVITVEHTIKMSKLIAGSQLAVLPGVHGRLIGEIGGSDKQNKQPEMTVGLVNKFLNE